MRIRITHLRNTKSHQDNQDYAGEQFAGSPALADRSTDVTAQDRTAQTDGSREDQPKGGDFVTVGLKDALDAQREVNAAEGGEEKQRERRVTDDHSQNGSYHSAVVSCEGT